MKWMLTGPRPTPGRLDQYKFYAGCKLFLKAVSSEGNENDLVISGGADGADRIWARAANDLHIPFAIYLPHGYYEHYFSYKQYDPVAQKSQLVLPEWCSAILDAAKFVRWTQDPGEPFNWRLNFARNRQMIENADAHVVASWVHPAELVPKSVRGGTAACVRDMARVGI
jgi:hypothetical protein